MPKINVNVALKTLEGEEIKENGKPLILKAILMSALCSPIKDENPDGMEKYRRYKLADRINKNDEAQLSAEDIVLLKTIIGKVYFPLIVGQVYDMLEPPN